MTSGPWQRCQVTEKSARLASKQQPEDGAGKVAGWAQRIMRPGLSIKALDVQPPGLTGAPEPQNTYPEKGRA